MMNVLPFNPYFVNILRIIHKKGVRGGGAKGGGEVWGRSESRRGGGRWEVGWGGGREKEREIKSWILKRV